MVECNFIRYRIDYEHKVGSENEVKKSFIIIKDPELFTDDDEGTWDGKQRCGLTANYDECDDDVCLLWSILMQARAATFAASGGK